MAVLTMHFNIQSANLAINSFIDPTTPKYLFVSRPSPWIDDSGALNDAFIPLASISVEQSESVVYSDLVFGKLIRSTDIISMVPRYDWISGTVYPRYWQSDDSLYTKNFYVVTDDLNVYKCIDNNYESVSIIKPTVISAYGTFSTSDGYIWKYLYTIPSDSDIKFSTASYIPVVANSQVAGNTIPGTIDLIDLTSFGNNYSAYYSGFLENSIDGSVVVLDQNASPYSNFYVGSSIYLKSGLGSGQLRQITQYDGLNKLIKVDTPFDTYAVLSLSSFTGVFNVGDTITQNLDSLFIYYVNGIFQPGDTVVQSDTGATGQIIFANSINLGVSRTASIPFTTNTPIYNTNQSGNLQPGTVTSVPYTALYTLSNTGAFTIGEKIYQSNGSSNVGIGIVLDVSNVAVTNQFFNPVSAVISNNNFIRFSPNPFVLGQEVVYHVANGNTAVFGISNNSTYYVSYSNTSGISLASSVGGANITLSLSKNETFNPNTGINATSGFITLAANWFSNDQALIYTVSSGNTTPIGLANGLIYYAVYANSSGTSLSLVPGGVNVQIIPSSVSETGHTLTFYNPSEYGHSITFTQAQLLLSQVNGAFGTTYQIKGNVSSSNAYLQTVLANNAGLGFIYSTNTAQTNFVNTYPIGSYIRVGSNTSLNIRKVTSVNSLCVGVDIPLSSLSINQPYFYMPSAAEIASYVIVSANGYISNTNLSSVNIQFSNSALFGRLFTLGERVNLVNNNNIFEGTYGIVSYSDTSSVIVSEVTGTGFVSGFYLAGESSRQVSYIDMITSYPTLVLSSPMGNFLLGQQIYSRDSANLSTINGQGNLVSYYETPGQLTEYIISPTVTVTGDGEGALAYSTVNTSSTANFPIANIIMIDSGNNYTFANVAITSNVLYGDGATAIAGISPRKGHGSDVYNELGARYVGISVNVANCILEDYYFPITGSYRKIGILDSPSFETLFVNISNFDRVQLSINNISNAFSTGEVVYQPNTYASGLVVYSNTTFLELNNVKGIFSANGKFANGSSSNDNVQGLYSNTTANVALARVSFFIIEGADQVVYEVNSGASGTLLSVQGSSNLQLSNIQGIFDNDDVLYDPITNAYGVVSGMTVSNGTVDVTESFGLRFNQTMRFPLTGNVVSFQLFETIIQDTSEAIGTIVGGSVTIPAGVNTSIGNDVDITYSNLSGTLPVGSVIYNVGNTATAIIISSNSSYLRLSGVTGNFSPNERINSLLGATANVGNIYPVLILNNVDGIFSSGILSGNVTGSNTGAYGRCDLNNVIVHPDLVRNSGKVMYLENLSPFGLSNSSQENLSIILKF